MTHGGILALAGLMIAGLAGPAAADVTVVVGPVPSLVVVFGTGVRYCESCDEDVFFYGGLWYVYRYDGWYRCRRWGAPWVRVERGRLPSAFIRVPPGRFRHRWGGYHPAHDHHPKLDTWRDGRRDGRDGRRDERAGGRDGRDGSGRTVIGDGGKDRDGAKGKAKEKDKDRGKEKGRGGGPDRGRR